MPQPPQNGAEAGSLMPSGQTRVSWLFQGYCSLIWPIGEAARHRRCSALKVNKSIRRASSMANQRLSRIFGRSFRIIRLSHTRARSEASDSRAPEVAVLRAIAAPSRASISPSIQLRHLWPRSAIVNGASNSIRIFRRSFMED
jgi:hypothetical protein